MNAAVIVQALTTAILTYLATKGLRLDAHAQAELAAGITLVASWVLPTIVRWENVHAREVGAVLGAIAVGGQILISLNLAGELQAILSAVLTLVAALTVPAAAHRDMPTAAAILVAGSRRRRAA